MSKKTDKYSYYNEAFKIKHTSKFTYPEDNIIKQNVFNYLNYVVLLAHRQQDKH